MEPGAFRPRPGARLPRVAAAAAALHGRAPAGGAGVGAGPRGRSGATHRSAALQARTPAVLSLRPHRAPDGRAPVRVPQLHAGMSAPRWVRLGTMLGATLWLLSLFAYVSTQRDVLGRWSQSYAMLLGAAVLVWGVLCLLLWRSRPEPEAWPPGPP